MKRAAALTLVCCAVAPALRAQETQVEAEFRRERMSFSANCAHPMGSFFGAVAGCGQVLFTGQPLHIAIGSLAPQNGVGTGLALTTHYTPNENWRLFFDIDAVASSNLSWRAGAYMTAVLIRHPKIVVITGPASATKSSAPVIEEMPAFHVYSQSISLNKLIYFGLGQGTSAAGRSYYGMTQTIVGANAVFPVFAPANLSLFAEVNGRFVDLRGNNSQTSPSIETLYNETTAPGLAQQPGYAQFGQGIRLQPSFANGHIRLNYSADFQEWVTGTSGFSFTRFTADASHQFPLYRNTRSLNPREFNGPDSCLQSPTAQSCPAVTRNLEGSFGFQFLYTASYVPGGHAVPFYFDPTLGGSDINGTTLLGSYEDYRFRGPDMMLLRGSFEHSIFKLPLGVKFMVDEGRVGLTPGQLGFNHLAHSFGAGLTLRAGGLPLIDLLFAWGGHEGNHTIASISNSLLGGGSRPSLY